MKVVLRMPDGTRAVGSQVRVVMQPLRLTGILNLFTAGTYDYIVTSDESGVAEFIDPGLGYALQSGELTAKHSTMLGAYYYTGIVRVNALGQFEQDQSLVLSPQKPESKDQNPYLQFAGYATIIVVGIVGLAILRKVPNWTTKRYKV